MYRHIVLFWLKEPTEENLCIARDKLHSLAGKIEGLLSCEVEIDALHSDRSCHLCLNMVFDSKAALDAYRTHPEHLPVQAHMHAVRSGSHAADYPIPLAPRRTPLLYATLGPACADAETIERLFDEGMSGIRLSLTQRTLAETLPWIDTFHTAAAHAGIAPSILLDFPAGQSLPAELASFGGATGLLLALPHSMEQLSPLLAPLIPRYRILAKVIAKGDVDALPLLLAHTNEIVVARLSMGRNMPRHEIPGIQKRVATAANAVGKPFMVAGGLLSSMRDQPVPTSAEALDIYNAVQDGASSLLLAEETSIGKYPADAMGMLRKVVESALRE